VTWHADHETVAVVCHERKHCVNIAPSAGGVPSFDEVANDMWSNFVVRVPLTAWMTGSLG
jgi:hypothetical protein